MEVCPLSRETMSRGGAALNLYPFDYRNGIRFLHPPIPAAPSARLAARFPSKRDNLTKGGLRAYHVSCECQSGLGLASPPVAQRLRRVS
jgi:hypothetical protein